MSSASINKTDNATKGSELHSARQAMKTSESFAGLFADIVGGIIMWSLITFFPAAMFYIPMVEMSYTGFEATLVLLFAACFLSIPSLRYLAASKPYAFRFISLIGIASYFVFPLEYKIGLTGIGLATDLIGTFGLWMASTKERRERSIYGHMIGFIIAVILRMAYRSVNPIWYTFEGNVATLGVGLISTIIYYIQGHQAIPQKSSIQDPSSPSSIFSGLTLGSMIFLLHLLFTGHGVISRWVELPPFPHGVLVILSLCVGLLLSTSRWVESAIWWLMTAGLGWVLFASMAGTFFNPYVEFFGGLLLGVYVFSVFFTCMNRITRSRSPFLIFFVGMGLYIGFQLWALYTVAYKFVPGGWLLRERSKSVISVPLIFCALSHVRRFFPENSDSQKSKKESVPSSVKTTLALVAFLLLSPVTTYRFIQSSEKHNRTFQEISPMIWAIHFGYDNFGGLNYEGLSSTIKKSNANIVGLVETDCMRTAMDNRDVVEWLGEDLHYWNDYGPSTAQNTWGCGFLSAFPIVRAERIVMPSPHGELACLIDADVEVNGTVVRVITTHFGNTEDKEDLELQTRNLIETVQARPGFAPTIMIGYLTTPPFSERYTRILNLAKLKDTTTSLDRYCEYVLYKDLNFTRFYRIDKGDVSDTEAQVAAFQFPLTANGTIGKVDPQPGTFENCKKFHNDSVGCIAHETCGWCQLGNHGSCYEPSHKPSCDSLAGSWVGPNVTQKSVNKKTLDDFIALQFEQQKLGHDAVTRVNDDTFTWTIDRFAEMDFFIYWYSSPTIAYKGSYWRLVVNMPYKSGAKKNRIFGLFLQPVPVVNDPNPVIAPTAELTIENQNSNSKGIKSTIRGGYRVTTVTDSKYRGPSLSYEQLTNGYLVNDSVKLTVKFS